MDFDIKLTLDKVSLFDFGKGLIATLISNDVQVPNENRDWHKFFYELKKEERDGKPGFFNGLEFDWDAPYLKSPYLSEFFEAIYSVHYPARYHFGIVLDRETIDYWMRQVEKFSPELRNYFDYAAEKARNDLIH